MLGEPARTQGDLNFVLFGIPVRIHPFFWIAGLLLGMGANQSVPEMLLWMVAFFAGILIHELGHALVMRTYGIYAWITLYGLGGMASYNPTQAYSLRRDDPFRQILISAAGPGAGFLLAAAILGMVVLTGHSVAYHLGLPFGVLLGVGEIVGNVYLSWFINDLLFVTVVYGIFNLLPILPLDGGNIAREIFLKMMPRDGVHHSLMLSIFTAGGLALLHLVNCVGNRGRGSFFLVILFGYLAFSSYQALQSYGMRGRW